jgi:hypothetical protein
MKEHLHMIFITKVYQVYLLLKGYQPDGDSIRFMADDRLDYEDLYRYHRLPPDKRADPVQSMIQCSACTTTRK